MLLWRSLFVLAATAFCAFAQTPGLAGDYSGVLGPLHLNLHVKNSASGGFEGTLDSPDQGARGLPCVNFKVVEKSLSFDVASVGGNWKGTISDDAKTLSGNWSQGGQSMPLTLTRDKAAGKPSKVDGTWLGTLEAGGQHLRLQLHLQSEASGKEHGTLDQMAFGLSCDNIRFEGSKLSFDVPSVHGNWSGTLSDDGDQLTGRWSQGQPLPLNLTRQKESQGPSRRNSERRWRP